MHVPAVRNQVHEGGAAECLIELKVGFTLPADPEAAFTPARVYRDPPCHGDVSAAQNPSDGYGLITYAGAVVFCPLSQHPDRKFGRYGSLTLLLPGGIRPTFAGPLMRASTRSPPA